MRVREGPSLLLPWAKNGVVVRGVVLLPENAAFLFAKIRQHCLAQTKRCQGPAGGKIRLLAVNLGGDQRGEKCELRGALVLSISKGLLCDNANELKRGAARRNNQLGRNHTQKTCSLDNMLFQILRKTLSAYFFAAEDHPHQHPPIFALTGKWGDI